MAEYLVQVAYTPEAYKALVANPQNRIDAVRPAIERLGGSVTGAWFTFGEYDVVIVTKMPDNVSAAAFSFAVSAGGAVKAIKTTPLMSTEEAVEGLRRASNAGYEPPSG